MSGPANLLSKISFFAINLTKRFAGSAAVPASAKSKYPMWLIERTAPPSRGIFSTPSKSNLSPRYFQNIAFRELWGCNPFLWGGHSMLLRQWRQVRWVPVQNHHESPVPRTVAPCKILGGNWYPHSRCQPVCQVHNEPPFQSRLVSLVQPRWSLTAWLTCWQVP